MRQREVSYDLLRVIGILVIMIAHADPPLWLFQLRNFGTPILIVTSALTHAYIYRDRSIAILPFYKKRMSRLIFRPGSFLLFSFCSILFLPGQLEVFILLTGKRSHSPIHSTQESDLSGFLKSI